MDLPPTTARWRGAVVGLVLAWMAGRALKTQLYGVGSADAIALTLAPALLLVTALLAGLRPARRAGPSIPPLRCVATEVFLRESVLGRLGDR